MGTEKFVEDNDAQCWVRILASSLACIVVMGNGMKLDKEKYPGTFSIKD